MKTYPSPNCYIFKNVIDLTIKDKSCKAFPEGIPDNIFFHGEPHEKPVKGQGNSIVYEAGNPSY